LGAVLIIIGYLLGSIPSAYIAGRFKGIDIRKVGDGNVGAANAFREVGPIAGILVILADVFKGVGAVFVAQAFTGSQLTVFLVGMAAVAGHVWPVYIGFKGGRGEAVAGGVLVALIPPMLILLAIGLIPFLLTRNTLVLGAILFAPLWLVVWITGGSLALIGYSILLPCLVGVSHVVTTRNLPEDLKKSGRIMH
jgi:acyl phosphate:glycerol-3-phosphate acyltransferase